MVCGVVDKCENKQSRGHRRYPGHRIIALTGLGSHTASLINSFREHKIRREPGAGCRLRHTPLMFIYYCYCVKMAMVDDESRENEKANAETRQFFTSERYS